MAFNGQVYLLCVICTRLVFFSSVLFVTTPSTSRCEVASVIGDLVSRDSWWNYIYREKHEEICTLSTTNPKRSGLGSELETPR
jgi:hypothetical protein